MGRGYDGSVALAKESSLAALPESQQLGADGFAKGSAMAALARLANKHARVGTMLFQHTLPTLCTPSPTTICTLTH